jgi:hypothetical protein
MNLQLDHALLGPLLSRDGIGAYGEATFLYKPTGTLLVTDVVIQVHIYCKYLHYSHTISTVPELR